jgi:hypothetical protein
MSRSTEAKKVAMQRFRPSRQHVVGAVVVIATLMAVGAVLFPTQLAIGVAWLLRDKQGVFADCTKGQNRGNRFCREDYSNGILRNPQGAAQRNHQVPADSLPFSLHSD